MVGGSPGATALAIILLSAAFVNAGPINRKWQKRSVGDFNSTDHIFSQDLGGECVTEHGVYHGGESVPSPGPCETCTCRPPTVFCSMVRCPINPGCRTIQRSNQCCPDYRCECEHDGRSYNNGEKIVIPEQPCQVCYCKGGEVMCTSITCYQRDDCEPRYIPGQCCPKYDHCPPLDSISSSDKKADSSGTSIKTSRSSNSGYKREMQPWLLTQSASKDHENEHTRAYHPSTKQDTQTPSDETQIDKKPNTVIFTEMTAEEVKTKLKSDADAYENDRNKDRTTSSVVEEYLDDNTESTTDSYAETYTVTNKEKKSTTDFSTYNPEISDKTITDESTNPIDLDDNFILNDVSTLYNIVPQDNTESTLGYNDPNGKGFTTVGESDDAETTSSPDMLEFISTGVAENQQTNEMSNQYKDYVSDVLISNDNDYATKVLEDEMSTESPTEYSTVSVKDNDANSSVATTESVPTTVFPTSTENSKVNEELNTLEPTVGTHVPKEESEKQTAGPQSSTEETLDREDTSLVSEVVENVEEAEREEKTKRTLLPERLDRKYTTAIHPSQVAHYIDEKTKLDDFRKHNENIDKSRNNEVTETKYGTIKSVFISSKDTDSFTEDVNGNLDVMGTTGLSTLDIEQKDEERFSTEKITSSEEVAEENGGKNGEVSVESLEDANKQQATKENLVKKCDPKKKQAKAIVSASKNNEIGMGDLKVKKSATVVEGKGSVADDGKEKEGDEMNKEELLNEKGINVGNANSSETSEESSSSNSGSDGSKSKRKSESSDSSSSSSESDESKKKSKLKSESSDSSSSSSESDDSKSKSKSKIDSSDSSSSSSESDDSKSKSKSDSSDSSSSSSSSESDESKSKNKPKSDSSSSSSESTKSDSSDSSSSSSESDDSKSKSKSKSDSSDSSSSSSESDDSKSKSKSKSDSSDSSSSSSESDDSKSKSKSDSSDSSSSSSSSESDESKSKNKPKSDSSSSSSESKKSDSSDSSSSSSESDDSKSKSKSKSDSSDCSSSSSESDDSKSKSKSKSDSSDSSSSSSESDDSKSKSKSDSSDRSSDSSESDDSKSKSKSKSDSSDSSSSSSESDDSKSKSKSKSDSSDSSSSSSSSESDESKSKSKSKSDSSDTSSSSSESDDSKSKSKSKSDSSDSSSSSSESDDSESKSKSKSDSSDSSSSSSSSESDESKSKSKSKSDSSDSSSSSSESDDSKSKSKSKSDSSDSSSSSSESDDSKSKSKSKSDSSDSSSSSSSSESDESKSKNKSKSESSSSESNSKSKSDSSDSSSSSSSSESDESKSKSKSKSDSSSTSSSSSDSNESKSKGNSKSDSSSSSSSTSESDSSESSSSSSESDESKEEKSRRKPKLDSSDSSSSSSSSESDESKSKLKSKSDSSDGSSSSSSDSDNTKSKSKSDSDSSSESSKSKSKNKSKSESNHSSSSSSESDESKSNRKSKSDSSDSSSSSSESTEEKSGDKNDESKSTEKESNNKSKPDSSDSSSSSSSSSESDEKSNKENESTHVESSTGGSIILDSKHEVKSDSADGPKAKETIVTGDLKGEKEDYHSPEHVKGKSNKEISHADAKRKHKMASNLIKEKDDLKAGHDQLNEDDVIVLDITNNKESNNFKSGEPTTFHLDLFNLNDEDDDNDDDSSKTRKGSSKQSNRPVIKVMVQNRKNLNISNSQIILTPADLKMLAEYLINEKIKPASQSVVDSDNESSKTNSIITKSLINNGDLTMVLNITTTGYTDVGKDSTTVEVNTVTEGFNQNEVETFKPSELMKEANKKSNRLTEKSKDEDCDEALVKDSTTTSSTIKFVGGSVDDSASGGDKQSRLGDDSNGGLDTNTEEPCDDETTVGTTDSAHLLPESTEWPSEVQTTLSDDQILKGLIDLMKKTTELKDEESTTIYTHNDKPNNDESSAENVHERPESTTKRKTDNTKSENSDESSSRKVKITDNDSATLDDKDLHLLRDFMKKHLNIK